MIIKYLSTGIEARMISVDLTQVQLTGWGVVDARTDQKYLYFTYFKVIKGSYNPKTGKEFTSSPSVYVNIDAVYNYADTIAQLKSIYPDLHTLSSQ